MRGDGTQVGWIPASYVRAINDATAAKLYVRKEQEIASGSGSGSRSQSVPPDFDSSDEDEETDFGTSTTFTDDTEATEYMDALEEQSLGTMVTAGSTSRDPTSVRGFGQCLFLIWILNFQHRLYSKLMSSKRQIRKPPLDLLPSDRLHLLPGCKLTNPSLRPLSNSLPQRNGACAIVAVKVATSSFPLRVSRKPKTMIDRPSSG